MVKYSRLLGLALVVFAHCGALSSPAVRKPFRLTSPNLDQVAQLETDDKRMRQGTDATNLTVSEERAVSDVGPATKKGIARLISNLKDWRWIKDIWKKLKNSKLMKALERWMFKKRIRRVPEEKAPERWMSKKRKSVRRVPEEKASERWMSEKQKSVWRVPEGKAFTDEEKVLIAQISARKKGSHEEMYKQGVRPSHVAKGLGLETADLNRRGPERLEKIDELLSYERFKKYADEQKNAEKKV